MTAITVYDPAKCGSTSLCGTEVDQRLVDLAADLEWLRAQGVTIRRFGLSREPAAFAANDTIRQITQASEGDDLPVFLVDGGLKAKACDPVRAKMAEWVDEALPKLKILIFLLPETTSVLAAVRLQEDLKRAGFTPCAWVNNASLAATATKHPVLADRAATEASEIAAIRNGLASHYAVVPMLAEDPVGAERMRALVGRSPAMA